MTSPSSTAIFGLWSANFPVSMGYFWGVSER